jgi:hypothetical protein
VFSLGRWRTWPGDDMPAYAFLGESGPVGTSPSTSNAYGGDSIDPFPSKVSDDTTASLAGASAGSESTSRI